MARRLLVVEDTFVLKRLGIVLAPFVSVEELPDMPFERRFDVELRSPEGTTRKASAVLTIPRVADMKPPYKAALRLPDETADAVPPGTEVWTV
jgi:hypothetical protein